MGARKARDSKSSTAITTNSSNDPYAIANTNLDQLMEEVRTGNPAARLRLRDEGFYYRLKIALANDKRKAMMVAGTEE
jgi:hypothetical protein